MNPSVFIQNRHDGILTETSTTVLIAFCFLCLNSSSCKKKHSFTIQILFISDLVTIKSKPFWELYSSVQSTFVKHVKIKEHDMVIRKQSSRCDAKRNDTATLK